MIFRDHGSYLAVGASKNLIEVERVLGDCWMERYSVAEAREAIESIVFHEIKLDITDGMVRVPA